MPDRLANARAAKASAKSVTSLAREATQSMTPERKEAVLWWLKGIPATQRRGYLRAVAGKSLRSAINAQCLDCCCFQRTEVAACEILHCPLWSYRPYQPKEEPCAS